MDVTPADLGRIRDLYSRGLYRQALAAGERFGPLRAWPGPAARLLAGRLAIQLGAPKLGKRLHLVAYRQSPAFLEAVYYHARYRLEQFGPLSCWRFARQHPDWSDAPPELRADWLAVQALACARVRDFDRAERFLAQAEALAPDRAWVQVERSSVLDLAERPAEALEAARRALELHPWFRPGVQSAAHLLHRTGRETEAIDLLTEAADHLESGVVLAQLAALQLDLGRCHDARRSLDRYAELSPLTEPEVARWLAARRADVAYLLGEFAGAEEQARRAGEDFYIRFADNLSEASPGHRTGECANAAPRTLLSLPAYPAEGPPAAAHDLLARFWRRPAPPTAAAADEPPALDGLPDAAERRRFDAAGWATREFTLTLDAACELVGRGVPFLVTLVETGFGQPRLVVGADRLRGSIFLADGPDRRPAEAPISLLIERYRVFGPRCLAAVPADETHRLDGLTLPESGEYDRLYAIQAALLDLKFAEAKGRLADLQAEFPGRRLTRFAAVAWARATAHPVLLLDALDALLADYPHDPTLVLSKTAVLRDLGRVRERMELLKAEGSKAGAEPLLMQSLAQALLTDPAGRAEADRLLRRSVRVRPHAAAGYFLLASERWEAQQFDEAVELYRFAACMDDREDQFAEAYARAAAATGAAPEPLRLFQQKATRARVPSPPAVRALFNALADRDEEAQAFAALGKAIEKLTPATPAAGEVEPMYAPVAPPVDAATGGRPSPGEMPDEHAPADNRAADSLRRSPELAELLLFRAEMYANRGRFDEAEADLTAARPHAPPAVWFRSAARVARTRPDYVVTLARLRGLLDHDPLSPDGHRLTAALLADTEGRAAARAYLDELARRYPDVYPLVRLRAEFVYPDPDDAAVAATQALIDLCPRDAWALRQLALVYADRNRPDEALAAITTAGEIEPDHPSQFAVLAHVHRRADRTDEALAAFRAGVECFPDHEVAVFELVQMSRGLKEKKAALRFVAERLHARPHGGDGLLAYFDRSVDMFRQFAEVIDPDELERFVAELDRFLDERPDLWQAWSVNVQALVMAHRAEEAVALARDAAERFPLVARVWVDVAEACEHAGRPDDRLDALKQAAAVAPGWVPAVRELADALAEAGHDDEAVAALERAAWRSPLDPLAHWHLAERLWQAGRSREALDRAKTAVRLDTGMDFRAETAWSAVMVWSERLDCPGEAVELARELTRDRAGDPRAWLRLARCLPDPERTDEALEALDRAIELDPRNIEAHDLKAERLAALGRFDEALAAARPPELGADLPLNLQGRAAWVEARRGNYAAAIPPMQALVAVDPDYIWGWQQLAEWYNETGRPQNYLEAASELARLRPDHPTSLTMRGEARLQTGDREGGKADLREALRVHPGYSPAAVILFDACLADGESRDARSALAVLQEHLAGPEVLVKQLQFSARTGDADGAARAFAELCQTPGEGPPLFVQMALSEMHNAGWDDTAAAVMQAAWQSDDEFNPWAAIYWLDTPDGDSADPDTKLAACDAVVRSYPQFVPGHDRRAEQLALMGRYDEAAEACRPPGVTPLPVALRGRAAWVEAHRGDRARAIALMKQTVADEPNYGWGWRQLAQWYDAAGRYRECLEAANQLIRITPDDPVAHAIRGEAKRALGDHHGAADDYRKAFEIDPTFEAAGLQLIAAQLATDDVTGAARTLYHLQEHADGPLVKLRAVQVAARQGNLAQARAGFGALTTDPAATRGVLREAHAALTAAGWQDEADEELEVAIDDPDLTPSAAGLWVERTANGGETWRAGDRLPELIDRNRDAGREAVLTYAWVQAASGQADTVAATVQRHAELLREDDEGWARAGGLLAEARNFALCAAWLADWRDRPGCRPWMLRPLTESLRALDRDAEADAVARAAVAMAEPDGAPPDFRAWLALSAAAGGRTAEAAEHLRAIEQLGLPDGVKLLLAMAEALVMVQQAGPAGKRQAFTEAREHLHVAAGACEPKDVPPGAARWFRKVADRLAADAGTLPARLWALWQHARPWVREG
jgi:tetratricopeptide (TPR) repeat protein